MTLFVKAQQLVFRTRAAWGLFGLLGVGLYAETHDLRYGVLVFLMGLVVAWSMAVHPRADTPEAPFITRRWVRWTFTVIAVVGLLCAFGVAIFYSSWRPQAG